jgi:type IV pilus assembly protein PilW
MSLKRHPSQAGFTLVELMISVVIGLFIVLALVTLLINISRNNSELSKTNRVIENGRFALQLLAADVAHAGFWGGYLPAFDDLTNNSIPGDVPTAVPDPCLAYTPVAWDAAYKTNLVGIPIQTYEVPGGASPAVPVCSSVTGTAVQGTTTMLIVRHADTCAAGVDAGCPAPSAGDLYFQISRCGTSAPTTPYVLEPFPSDAATINTIFPLKDRAVAVGGVTPACTDPAVAFAIKRKFVSNLYYIRNYAVNAGDGVPTLMRSQFNGAAHAPADALIEGIEGFQVELAVDDVSDSGAAVNYAQAVSWANAANLNSPTNRGDGLPDGPYVFCSTAAPCTAAQLMNTVAVRIFVLVRSENKTPGYVDTKTYTLGSTTMGPFNDGYKRHLFTQTVRLTNVSSRRETP